MTTRIRIALLAAAVLGLAACSGGEEPTDTAALEKDADAAAAAQAPSTPGSIFNVDYRIVGTPVVGSPLAIDLEISSGYSDAPVDIDFQITDPSALAVDAAQPLSLTRTPEAGETVIRERVTLIPQREGRLFFNVSASHPDSAGTATTVISIPIHVGDVDTSLVEVGELQTNEEGETTRVLTSE